MTNFQLDVKRLSTSHGLAVKPSRMDISDLRFAGSFSFSDSSKCRNLYSMVSRKVSSKQARVAVGVLTLFVDWKTNEFLRDDIISC